MAGIGRALSDLVENIVAFVVMIILGIIGFYLTVFVVASGSSLAGFSPSGDFVVISAALIVAASIIGGMR
ncbi:MAG: hypothetical protein SVW77_01780 [Candidatus Nanohaloarchaea archaeon]|nr:hypothetical protein [Candidatus Nanohaloarchaea archaeon]